MGWDMGWDVGRRVLRAGKRLIIPDLGIHGSHERAQRAERGAADDRRGRREPEPPPGARGDPQVQRVLHRQQTHGLCPECPRGILSLLPPPALSASQKKKTKKQPKTSQGKKDSTKPWEFFAAVAAPRSVLSWIPDFPSIPGICSSLDWLPCQ